MASIYNKFKETAAKNGSKTIVYWKNKHWQSLSYKQFIDNVDNLAENLRSLGVVSGNRLAILSENRQEWLCCDLAVNKLGAVSVPLHAAANQPLIEYILKDSGSEFIFVSNESYKKHREMLDRSREKIKIILFDEPDDDKAGKYLFKDLIRPAGKRMAAIENELASLVYTSGTTGEPKGVMLTNNNLISNIEAVFKVFDINSNDKFLSFLPLSHILERTLGSYIPIMSGASIAYAENIKQLSANLKEIRPTIIIGVPRIFEKTKEKIFANIRNKNTLIKRLFFLSLKKNDSSLLKKVGDFLFYKKIRGLFGGRLRFAVSGGAAINEKILRFYNNVGIKIVEGYGLTETSPIVACNTVEERIIGSVGKPLAGVEVKITNDKEILVKGSSVTAGYWSKPELSKDVFDDGWFKTGDLGFIDRAGSLTIIGRKKDMIVTSNGKNIFPEKVENILNLSPYINQSLVAGHKRNYLIALIVPDWEIIKENYKDNADVNKIIEKEIDKANQQLMDYEKITRYHLLDRPFTVENEELTPTLKIRRHMIERKYDKLINSLY